MTDINNGSAASWRQTAESSLWCDSVLSDRLVCLCMRVFCGGGARFCHSSFCGVRFDGPSQATEALQPTRTHNYTHICRHIHLKDRQTDRQAVGWASLLPAPCIPSSAVCSRSFSLSLCFDVVCVCQQHACTIISAAGAACPLSLPMVKCLGHCFLLAVGLYSHTAKFRSLVPPQIFLAKWILNAN